MYIGVHMVSCDPWFISGTRGCMDFVILQKLHDLSVVREVESLTLREISCYTHLFVDSILIQFDSSFEKPCSAAQIPWVAIRIVLSSVRQIHHTEVTFPDSKVHGASIGPMWCRQDPGGPHVGPMKLATWDSHGVFFGRTQATIWSISMLTGEISHAANDMNIHESS